MGGTPLNLEPTRMVIAPLHIREPRATLVVSGEETDKIGTTVDHAVTSLHTFLSDDSTRSSDPVGCTQAKHVAFGFICSRSYQVIIGDNPCCSMGCPLTLGWDYSQCPSISVDQYEASRSPRRKREDLRTTWDQRRSMLADYSDEEIRRVNRKLARERSCQRKVNRRVSAAFFSRNDVPEDCEGTAAAFAFAQNVPTGTYSGNRS